MGRGHHRGDLDFPENLDWQPESDSFACVGGVFHWRHDYQPAGPAGLESTWSLDFTRHTIAVAQMLTSALLIHLSGGRIETHFHIFGSLAFLAFYRDWRVLMIATVVVAADHFLRGTFWPQSVFGVLTRSPWRWFVHAGWVVFEDFFLLVSIRQSLRKCAWMLGGRPGWNP